MLQPINGFYSVYLFLAAGYCEFIVLFFKLQALATIDTIGILFNRFPLLHEIYSFNEHLLKLISSAFFWVSLIFNHLAVTAL